MFTFSKLGPGVTELLQRYNLEDVKGTVLKLN